MTKQDDLRLERASALLSRLGRSSISEAFDVLADDIIWRVPGDNQFAGVYEGREIVQQHLLDLSDATSEFSTSKWDDWMIGTHHIAARAAIHATGSGRLFSGRQLYLLRFDVDDKINEFIVFFEDEEKADRFLEDRTGRRIGPPERG
jgi:ketosteroid isomerase-like protein